MKWFGESWGAPVCAKAQHVQVPVGTECGWCKDEVYEDDCGVIIPRVVRGETAYHRDCLIAQLVPNVRAGRLGQGLDGPPFIVHIQGEHVTLCGAIVSSPGGTVSPQRAAMENGWESRSGLAICAECALAEAAR